MILARVSILYSLLICLPAAEASELDNKLALVTEVYGLKSKTCETTKFEVAASIEAGRALFESVSLSGNRDTACSTCHLDQFESTDGLALSIGVGGHGEGPDRVDDKQGTLVQRNAFSLFGRSNPEFVSYFWDGKAQLQNGQFISQLSDEIPAGFKSLLSVAAILPLLERDEFIGASTIFSPNSIARQVEQKLYMDRYSAIEAAIQARVTHPDNSNDTELVSALEKSGIDIDELDFVTIGNLLAEFIDHKFRCKRSRWDRYLTGERVALTKEQKKGAILFYGKGRCASCHAGSFHSDFQFHSIGAPQGSFGPHSRHRDVGRAAVSLRAKDLYLFRTPPLNGVSKTAPYGHNGIFRSLKSIVVHHFNPIAFYVNNSAALDADYHRIGKFLESRDSVLATIDIDSDKEVELIVRFLESL